MKLKGRILSSMISVAVVIILILSSVNYFLSISAYKEEMDTRRVLEVEKLGAEVDEWIGREALKLDEICDSMAYMNAFDNLKLANGLLGKFVKENEYILDYYAQVDNKASKYVVSAHREIKNHDLTAREWYIEGKKSQVNYISEPYIDIQTGNLIITISKPFTSQGGTTGVIAADIRIDSIVELITSLNLGRGTEVFIIKDDGDLIVHQNTNIKNEETKPANIFELYGEEIRNIMEDEEIDIEDREFKSVEGKEKYFFLTKLENANWYVGAETDSKVISETLDRMIVLTLLSTALIVVGLFAISTLVANSISKPIRKSVEVLESIGDLDLTVEVSEEYLARKDEIGEMSKVFKTIIEKLQLFMYGMRGAIDINNNVYVETVGNVQMLNRQSEENAATTEELSAGMEETTATTENILGSVENIDGSIKNLSRMIETIDDISKKIQSESQNTNEEFTKSRDITLEKYTLAKENIEEAIESAKSVEEIGVLSESITKIAEQTTLLSLNAAIEAARAGESGKGFEVVAVEIRKLAEDSNEAAHQIKEITSSIEGSIGKLVYDTEGLIDLIEGSVMEDYNEIVDSTHESKENGITLDRAVDEIVKRSASINEDIGNITRSIEEISMTMEESTKATITIAEENMHMVASIHNIGEQMDDSKESGDRLEGLISEVKLEAKDI